MSAPTYQGTQPWVHRTTCCDSVSYNRAHGGIHSPYDEPRFVCQYQECDNYLGKTQIKNLKTGEVLDA